MTLKAKIESLLFVAGDEGLARNDFELLLNYPTNDIQVALDELHEKYLNDDTSGLALVLFANRYQLVTKGKYADIVKAYATAPFATKLSQASLETLAIIAYKQPITRLEIDRIRGVQSSGTIQKLQLRDLITSLGRQDSPGKPIMYGVSEYFMNYFGVSDLSELPNLNDLMVASDSELMDLFGERYARENQEQLEQENEDI